MTEEAGKLLDFTIHRVNRTGSLFDQAGNKGCFKSPVFWKPGGHTRRELAFISRL